MARAVSCAGVSLPNEPPAPIGVSGLQILPAYVGSVTSVKTVGCDGAAVTGAEVTGAAVTGAAVTGAEVTGAAVTGAAVTAGAVHTGVHVSTPG